MNKENHCTYKDQECNQFLDEGNGEKTVWWHISGLSGKKDADCPQIHTFGKPGDSMFSKFTPKEIAKSQAEKKLMSLISICIQCKASIRGILRMRKEAEPL